MHRSFFEFMHAAGHIMHCTHSEHCALIDLAHGWSIGQIFGTDSVLRLEFLNKMMFESLRSDKNTLRYRRARNSFAELFKTLFQFIYWSIAVLSILWPIRASDKDSKRIVLFLLNFWTRWCLNHSDRTNSLWDIAVRATVTRNLSCSIYVNAIIGTFMIRACTVYGPL
jgi:hypothetical protein